MNLVLAVAVNTYEDSIRARKTKRADLSKTLLNEAFTLLDSNNENLVSRDTILHVLKTLDEDVPDFQGLSDPAIRNIMFAFLDRNGTNALNRDEFLEFDSILQLHLGRQSIYTTFVEVNFPSIYESHWYQTFVSVIKSNRFDNAVEAVLIMNLILVFAQDYPILAGKDVSLSCKITVWENLETVFTAAYVVEALVKILVNGWKIYIESIRNCFDMFITILVVLATAWVYCKWIKCNTKKPGSFFYFVNGNDSLF
jgi:Ca2+-binding EF-hand superfamily protein